VLAAASHCHSTRSIIRAHEVPAGLFRSHYPKTVENFRALCTGETATADKPVGKAGKRLHYAGSCFHRIIPGVASLTSLELTQPHPAHPRSTRHHEHFSLAPHAVHCILFPPSYSLHPTPSILSITARSSLALGGSLSVRVATSSKAMAWVASPYMGMILLMSSRMAYARAQACGHTHARGHSLVAVRMHP